MKRALLFAFLLLAPALLAPALFAQTYAPKAIRVEGVPDADRDAVMAKLALPDHGPLTKEQIEEAIGRLAETGGYTDLSYKVDKDALTITVKTAEGTAQALPVVFENLVWWQPAELEALLEAKAPLYHGQLPLTGNLTDTVRKALEGLLTEKGVRDVRVEVSMQGSGRDHAGAAKIAMAVANPHVVVGDVTVTGTAADAAAQMQKVTTLLNGRDFSRDETLETVRLNVLDTHRNAGYLDATVDAAQVSGPRQDGRDYAVDVSATVHPQGLYRVSAISVEAITGDVPGVTAADVLKGSAIKAGDAAGEMTLRLGEETAARVLQSRGLLEAKVSSMVIKDAAAHTVEYRLTCMAGPTYTVERVDVSALPAEVGERLGKALAVPTGAKADTEMLAKIARALQAEGFAHKVTISLQQTKSTHTAVYLIRPNGTR